MGLKRDAARGRRRDGDGGERNERRAARISISSEAEPSLGESPDGQRDRRLHPRWLRYPGPS